MAFYTKQLFLDISTVECSTTASIRGPRNRGKFSDKYTSNRSETILASGTGNPGWSRTQPGLVCCGQIDIDVNTYLRPHTELRTRGSHSYRYRQDKATKDTYFYSFFPRTIRLWKSLPAEIAEISSLAIFTSELYNYLVN